MVEGSIPRRSAASNASKCLATSSDSSFHHRQEDGNLLQSPSTQASTRSRPYQLSVSGPETTICDLLYFDAEISRRLQRAGWRGYLGGHRLSTIIARRETRAPQMSDDFKRKIALVATDKVRSRPSHDTD
jgi:hypothetical protein